MTVRELRKLLEQLEVEGKHDARITVEDIKLNQPAIAQGVVMNRNNEIAHITTRIGEGRQA